MLTMMVALDLVIVAAPLDVMPTVAFAKLFKQVVIVEVKNPKTYYVCYSLQIYVGISTDKRNDDDGDFAQNESNETAV